MLDRENWMRMTKFIKFKNYVIVVVVVVLEVLRKEFKLPPLLCMLLATTSADFNFLNCILYINCGQHKRVVTDIVTQYYWININTESTYFPDKK